MPTFYTSKDMVKKAQERMGGSDGLCQISDSKIKRSIKTASNMTDMS